MHPLRAIPPNIRQLFAESVRDSAAAAAPEKIEAAQAAAIERFTTAGAGEHIATVAGVYAKSADAVALANQELKELAASLGSSEAQLLSNLSTAIGPVLAVAQPLVVAPPPPSYRALLKDALPAHADPKLLSLALVDVDHALKPGHESLAIDYVDRYFTFTACHDVAGKLNVLLGSGAPVTAKGEAGLKLAVEAVESGDAVIHIKYKHPKKDGHSFTLVSSPRGVESIEGWAGHAPHSAQRPWSHPLHLALERTDLGTIPRATAAAALAKVRDPEPLVRDAALKKLSYSGGLYAFEPEPTHELLKPSETMQQLTRRLGDEMELEVTVRKLETPEKLKQKMGRELEKAQGLVAHATLCKAQKTHGVTHEAINTAYKDVLKAEGTATRETVTKTLEAQGKSAGFIDTVLLGLASWSMLEES